MKLKTKHYLLLLLTCCVLSSCGFRLRGDNMVPPELRIVYLQTPRLYDPFTVKLRDNLTALGVQLAPSPQAAPLILEVIREEFTQTLTSISANTQVRRYRLLYTATFALKDRRGQFIFGPETVATSATYSTNDNQLLGDAELLRMQKLQMERELLFHLFNRLNSEEGRRALAGQARVSGR